MAARFAKLVKGTWPLAVGGFAVSQCYFAYNEAAANAAIAILGPVPNANDSGVRGRCVFKQAKEGDSTVKIYIKVTGLKPGKHGFHVHALGLYLIRNELTRLHPDDASSC